VARRALDEYRRKRDPERTPEPFGGRRPADGHLFVVHKHAARRLQRPHHVVLRVHDALSHNVSTFAIVNLGGPPKDQSKLCRLL